MAITAPVIEFGTRLFVQFVAMNQLPKDSAFQWVSSAPALTCSTSDRNSARKTTRCAWLARAADPASRVREEKRSVFITSVDQSRKFAQGDVALATPLLGPAG